MTIRITDPALLERQLLPDEAFRNHMVDVLASLPPRVWDADAFARGLRYPWYRPQRSYVLREGETVLLGELGETERRAQVERLAGPGSGRAPLLAIGSNAAPRTLATKLGSHPDPGDREVLVLAGELHDVDVAAHAAITVYGAMPATLVPSTGTRVDAALLFVTARQLTTLTWSELSYRLGRLRGTPFTVEDGLEGLAIESPLAYVSRWGAFVPDGEPAPLAAVAARDRRWRAWAQEELLDRAATIVLGDEAAGGAALMRAFHADVAATAARALALLREHAVPFDSPDWTPIAPDGSV